MSCTNEFIIGTKVNNMAKGKQGNTASAARRREQVRQQRQQAETQRTQTQQVRKTASRRRVARRSIWQSPWTLVGIIVVLVALVVGIFFALSNQSSQSASTDATTALKMVTSVDPKTLATVGNGGSNVKNLLTPTAKGSSPLKGSNGKPEVFYMGADYCPYCAAQRWAIIVALSRFGTFSQLTPIQSAEQNISTYTFHNSSYSSQYIDFVPVEIYDNQGNPLDKLTPDQQTLVNTYDAPPYVQANSKGSFPFIDIANQYVSSGAFYSQQSILNMSQLDIAKQITDSTTNVSKGVLGTANYLTAAICNATQNQPASVCTAAPIPQIQQSLPKASGSTGSQLAAIAGPADMITRRIQ